MSASVLNQISMASSQWTEDPCATKTYELKGTQTIESDSDDSETMEIRVENGGVSVLPEKLIKIETQATVEGNGQTSDTSPCATSGVDVQSANNHGVYYFPTQAMLAARQPYPAFVTHSPYAHMRAAHRFSHKRRTIEALAEGALMHTQEATLFEGTIAHAITKIAVFDNNTKMEVSQDVLRKENAAYTDPLENTVGLQKDAGEQFLKIGSCYSLQQESNSRTTETEEMTTGFVTHSATTTTNTATVDSNHTNHTNTGTNTGTNSETTPSTHDEASSTTVSQRDEKLTRVNITSANTASISSSSSNQNHSSLDLAKISFNKTLKKETVHKSLPSPNESVTSNSCAISSTQSPNSASHTSDESPTKPVYVPKEIKPGSVELRLDECVNVKDICDKELTKWTSNDVAKFVRATDCSEYADAFIEQEIDGKALMLLNQDLLIQWMKLKLGPAMKLYSHILNLKHALQKLSA